MSSVITGLLHSESDANWRFGNIRRSVMYNYPNGSAPLTALLSMVKEEVTNDPSFTIYEKRFAQQRSTTAAFNAAGPLAGADGATDLATGDIAADAVIFMKVASTSYFRVGHQTRIGNFQVSTGASTVKFKTIVTQVVSATVLKMRVLEAVTAYYNNAANVGLEVLVTGNAAEEGQVGAALAPYVTPDPITNYTQIFRTPYRVSGTAVPTALKYDKGGPLYDKAKDATLQHAIEMEKAFLFGPKTISQTNGGGAGERTRTTGGLEWYLQQWESGAVYGNTAATVDSDDNKRIITNSSGQIRLKTYNAYLERAFRVTSNQANEKVVLAGSGFMQTINDLYAGRTVLQVGNVAGKEFGWEYVMHRTPFGTIIYKTHPLFSQNDTLRYSALLLDIGNLKYRYMASRDTKQYRNRQPNNADYREDEWLGECGLELEFPESCMFFNNFQEAISG